MIRNRSRRSVAIVALLVAGYGCGSDGAEDEVDLAPMPRLSGSGGGAPGPMTVGAGGLGDFTPEDSLAVDSPVYGVPAAPAALDVLDAPVPGGRGPTVERRFDGSPRRSGRAERPRSAAGAAPRWSVVLGGALEQSGRSVGAEPTGGVFLAGSFEGAVELDEGRMASSGASDVLLARLDAATGAPVWSRRWGGPRLDTAAAVAFDPGSALVVTGSFEGSVTFGGEPLVAPSAREAAYVAKYGLDGEHVWSRAFDGIGAVRGVDVAVDADGGVFVVGAYDGILDLGDGPLTAHGGLDAFVAKLSPSGDLLWSKGIGGAADDAVRGVAVDPAGGAAVTGTFRSDAMKVDDRDAAVAGGADAFVLRIGDDGYVRQLMTFGGAGDEVGAAVAFAPDGALMIAGSFDSKAISVGGVSLKSAGRSDVFVAKLADAGPADWATRFGGPFDEGVASLAVDPTGHVVLAGAYDSGADFGGGRLETAGSSDAYVAKLSPMGRHVWTGTLGAPHADHALDVAVAGGTVVVAGELGGGSGDGMSRDLFVAGWSP